MRARSRSPLAARPYSHVAAETPVCRGRAGRPHTRQRHSCTRTPTHTHTHAHTWARSPQAGANGNGNANNVAFDACPAACPPPRRLAKSPRRPVAPPHGSRHEHGLPKRKRCQRLWPTAANDQRRPCPQRPARAAPTHQATRHPALMAFNWGAGGARTRACSRHPAREPAEPRRNVQHKSKAEDAPPWGSPNVFPLTLYFALSV